LRCNFAAVAFGSVTAGDVACFVTKHCRDPIVAFADFIKPAIKPTCPPGNTNAFFCGLSNKTNSQL
jgi:hypothetical protein